MKSRILICLAIAFFAAVGSSMAQTDTDTLTVTYTDAFALMRDLRGMGEANAVAARPRGLTRRTVLFEAAARYAALYGGPDGRIPATFQILYLAGWAPDDTQQKPLRPGSAAVRLAEAFGTHEHPAGEKTVPYKE